MAKFDFNRTTGGTLELVRDANGNYSVNKVGFTRLPALKLPDLSASTVTPPETIGPVPPDPTPKDETIEGQTAQAFQTGDDNREDFTNESMLKTAAQTSKLLTSTYDTQVEDETFADRSLKIKSPTESISGYDDAYIEDQKRKESGQYNLDDLLMDLPQDTRVKDENIIIPLRKPDGEVKKKFNLLEETNKLMESLKGERFKTKPVQENVDLDKEDAMLADAQKQPPKETLGISTPDAAQFQRQTSLPTQVDTQKAIGDYMDESVYSTGKTLGIGTSIPDPEQFRRQTTLPPETPKKSAVETVNTSLKKVFETFSPVGALVREIGRPVNESPGAVAFNTSYFQTRGDLGSSTDPGRIVGNPATNLYAGMNRVSKFGNLEKAGDKRIATREATIARRGIKSASNPNGVSQAFVDNTNNMKDQAKTYKQKKKEAPVTGTTKPGESGGSGPTGGGKSIVCTAMYQTTGLQDWAKAMKIWYIYQKRYLTIQHQEGYHKLFKPFVKGMHKNNIIKAIGAHFAKHRTQHLKHVLFKSKPSLLGKIYSKVLETICYWAGKK